VIASRCDAVIHDLTHAIAPQDVFEAAWFLRTVERWWPEGTIFVCVVDPGVGTSRRIIAMQSDGRVFLAPDNGLLTFISGATISVENESFFLPNGSTTFHGRDRFAPVAAAIANGISLDDLGPRIDDIVRLDYAPPVYAGTITGTIVTIDRFGNAITDIERARIPFASFALKVREQTITRLATSYLSGAPAPPPAGAAQNAGAPLRIDPFLIEGSTGMIEISIGGASAADVLHLRRGDPVEIIRS
jgi:S-adenosylmethionine hydrolase